MTDIEKKLSIMASRMKLEISETDHKYNIVSLRHQNKLAMYIKRISYFVNEIFASHTTFS